MKRIISILIIAALIALQALQVFAADSDTNAGYRMIPIIEQVKAITDEEAVNLAKKFTDMTGHWAGLNVGRLVAAGIVNGYPDSTFGPDRPLRVDEFITLVVKGLGYNITAAGWGKYWAQPYIGRAIADGIFKPEDFDRFDRSITREEMAKLLVNMVMLYDPAPPVDTAADDMVVLDIIDFDDIQDSAKQPVLIAYRLGLLSGMPDGTFRPKKELTRGEAAASILRAVDAAKRAVFVPTQERGIYLTNPYTNKRYLIRPHGVPKECITTAYVMRGLMEKSKGYALEVTSGTWANASYIFSIDQKHDELIQYDFGVTITCQTDGPVSRGNTSTGYELYTIEVYNKVHVRELHVDVIKGLFDNLFGEDAPAAMALFNKYMDLKWDLKKYDEIKAIHGREIYIGRDAGDAVGFGMSISSRGL